VSLTAINEVKGTKRLVFAKTLHPAQTSFWQGIEFNGDGGTLLISSAPGPRGDSRCDFAVWSTPELRESDIRSIAGHNLVEIYDREFKIFENQDFMARAFSVRQLRYCADMADFVARSRDDDLTETAWINRAEKIGRTEFGDAQISGVKQGWGRFEFKAVSAEPSFVVISNLYYPGGWRAEANGRAVKVRKVNGLLQGIELPPGENQVRLFYQPASFRLFIWMRLLLLLSFIGLVVWKYHVNRTRRIRPRSPSM